MKEKEKQLFKELCKFKGQFADVSLAEFAAPSVLGHLFFNRMQGIAYDTLKRNGLLGKVNREFRNSLGSASLQQRTCRIYLHEQQLYQARNRRILRYEAWIWL